MQKIYKYENGTVYITKPTQDIQNNLKTATETFLKKVVEERLKNGNSDKSRDIGK